MKQNYFFKSERLGFRNWLEEDIEPMLEINSDISVMEFFPDIVSKSETTDFIEKMRRQFNEKGFCYFAVDHLNTKELIGFIGLSEKTFEASFTPCIDIGWRLSSKHWNKGFATEGAKRCLTFAFEDLKLDKVNAIAPKVNIKSERIMQKIGMQKELTFKHPFLIDNPILEECLLYSMSSTDYYNNLNL